jgi:DNA-directed RNA polymerase subunit M/transcription elongation factor TFIIS
MGVIDFILGRRPKQQILVGKSSAALAVSEYVRDRVKKELKELKNQLAEANRRYVEELHEFNNTCSKCSSNDVINRIEAGKSGAVEICVCKSCQNEWARQSWVKSVSTEELSDHLCYFVDKVASIEKMELSPDSLEYDSTEQMRSDEMSKLLSSNRIAILKEFMQWRSVDLAEYLVSQVDSMYSYSQRSWQGSDKSCLEIIGIKRVQ